MPSAPEVLGIPNGRFAQNAWLVWDPVTRDAVLVDPGEDASRFLAAIRARDLLLREIWLTHAHLDHIWGVDDVRAATGALVRLHPDDRRWYDALPEQGRMFGIGGLVPPAPPDFDLVPGESVRVGHYTFDVRFVPGHAPGHVAFIGYGLCLSGDVLFEDSIGRTDLAGGDHAQLLESIRRELFPLPDDTRVLPGHGAETTIGRERRSNPFLTGLR